MRLTPRQLRILRDRPPAPVSDTSIADHVGALQSELRLLEPYASTSGLSRLKARVAELRHQIHKLQGLPIDG